MKRFLIFLTISIILLLVWLLTYLQAHYPAQPHLYVQSAPIWHIVLFGLWFAVQLYAGVCAVYWIWHTQLRRQQLAQQPPNHAH